MDRRTTPFSGRIAHVSLKGKVEAESFTEGAPHRISVALTDILRAPEGGRDRQILWGDRVLVIDRRDGFAHIMAEKDGYCGWVSEAALGPDFKATHRVAAPFSQIYAAPRVASPETLTLPFGAQVEVISESGKFAETTAGFVPMSHLRPLGSHESDPVAVAAGFLGTPYLWGANSRAGIDCSGLAQAAMLSCGIPCPGDSDLQAASGEEVAPEAIREGDLVFWKGHVAVISGPDEIIHATGAFMSVVRESLSGAIERIEAQGNGTVTHYRRLPRG